MRLGGYFRRLLDESDDGRKPIHLFVVATPMRQVAEVRVRRVWPWSDHYLLQQPILTSAGAFLKRGDALELTEDQAVKLLFIQISNDGVVDVLRSPVRRSGAWTKP